MEVKFISSIKDIAEQEWNTICKTDYPFTRYEFLSALEDSGATSIETGWQVNHALVYEGNILIAVMPCYIKQHSYGEFVFDFQWAQAYQRNGLNYYPKLLSAIPFSPVTGKKICIKEGYEEEKFIQIIINACVDLVKEKNLSSWHINFVEKNITQILSSLEIHTRRAVQFHWENDNYHCFDDFLVSFKSRHRKKTRKERKKISEQQIIFQHVEGADIDADHWKIFYYFYQLTHAKYSGHGGYLNPEFFYALGRDMPENLLMVLALKDGRVIAAALNLKSNDTLFGRYWGCCEAYDFLHFETCYYQGIEYCINRGLKRFDPGAQGEHKIQRGFKPTFTYSNHWIKDVRFKEAINQFLVEENDHIERYKEEASKLLPFRSD